MTEIDYLKCKLEDTEKAFDKLHKRYIELLKQQGNLEKENEQLRKQIQNYEPLFCFCDEEDFCRLFDKLNEQQSTIDKLEQRDYYNQSERYKILCRAIELTANYIDNSNEEHYDFCALVTEFEKELLK